jgi:hypothetical protein
MKGVLFFIRGIRFGNIRPALYGWFFNGLFTLVAYLAFYKVFSDAAGESVIAGDIDGQVGLFTFIADIYNNHPGSMSLAIFMGILSLLFFVAAGIYAGGGIYGVMVENDKPTFLNMVAASNEHFFSMIKIFLFNLIPWLISVLLPGILLLLIVTGDPARMNETLLNVLLYAVAALAALLVTIATLLYDFSRIFRIRDDQNIYQTVKRGLRFILSNKLSIVVIVILYGFSLLLFYVVYALLMNVVESFLFYVFIFLLYQGFVMARYFMKIVLIRAEIELVGIIL